MDNKTAWLLHEQDTKRSKERRKIADLISKKKKEERKKLILNPPSIKNKKILWKSDDSFFILLFGEFKKEKVFQIKKGLLNYELKCVPNKIIEYKPKHYSPSIATLQNKAEKIISSL